ncbi:MAG: SDR family oxidoreductase [Betaproteobacteria bacterium]|nr:SDR family oxidoreductase [Betaproteobacteria bacterium]
MSDTILVFGATGMLGQALLAEGRRRGLKLVGVARSGADVALDMTDAPALAGLVAEVRPSVVVNAAALTSLDACEKDPCLAYRVNARAVAMLAEATADAYFIQISTDHYYSGDGAALHDEDSPIRLVNEYARSKYAGEAYALTHANALVLRTNIVGFRNRGASTFVEWALDSLCGGQAMTLLEDYFTSSIDVASFSKGLLDLLPLRPTGRLNLAAREVASKARFIEALAEAAGYGTSHCRSGSILELEGPRRAESLGLDVARAERLLGYRLPTFSEVIDNLLRHRGMNA